MVQTEHYLPGAARNMNFKSPQSFQKEAAFLHIHHIAHHKASKVMIAGKWHILNCKHCKKRGESSYLGGN